MKIASPLILCTFATLGLSTASSAQNKNVKLLSIFKPSRVIFTDVWGYVDPTGREYVLAGSTTGTYVLNCTDPSKPVQTGFIANSASSWRANVRTDIKTYRKYAYVVSEGGRGMQIIDLGDPEKPKLVKTWGASIWSHTHNIVIDTQRGVAYACGTNVGMPVIDIKSDPVNPKLITRYTSAYVHDIAIQDGIAHLAEIRSARYRLVDITSLPVLTTLGTFSGISSCHVVWPTRDNNYAVTTSETLSSAGYMRVFDIRNKSAPKQIATYIVPGSSRSAHNAYFRDRVVYMSYYSEGLRVVDLSVPAKPVEVGFYDTDGTNSGYRGSWGCYPFMPSGTVYLTSRDLTVGSSVGGLYFLDPTASSTLYGKGTPGTGGAVPSIHTFGSAYLGNSSFELTVENGKASTRAALLVGVKQAKVSAGSVEILVDLSATHIIVTGKTDSSGAFSVPVPVANRSGLNGLVVYCQFFVQDSKAGGGLATSRGLKLVGFSR